MNTIKHTAFILIILILSGCQQKRNIFSDTEVKLMDSLSFDKNAFAQLKEYTKADFVQFETSDPGYIFQDGNKVHTGIEKQNGISFKIAEQSANYIISKFKDDLKQKGYLIFLSEQGYIDPSTITIIKSTDYFDILRIQRTDGINYGLENKDIIEKLTDWDNRYGIEILGADYDWIDIELKNNIDNIPAFAQEVYEFCPDAVDQGVGEIEELENIIREYRRLFLWWD